MVETCVELGISYLTFITFSSENWRRGEEEVFGLLELIAASATEGVEVFQRLGVRVLWSGRRDRVPVSVRQQLEDAEALTADNTVMTFVYGTDYGGQDDLLRAVQCIVREVAAGNLSEGDVAAAYRGYLDSPEVPDIDLFIRTSGEQRLSNGPLWQMAYAELMFLDMLWPDFRPDHLREAVAAYQQRDRRFGRIRGQDR